MRIIVLGDFHIPKKNPEMSQQAIDDIIRCQPDLVVPLGDFGAPGKIGTPEGLEETYSLLTQIDAPIRPILGNHDMEHESGVARQLPGTMQRLFLRLFDLDEAYGVVEREDVRFVFITTEYQSPDICYQVQECYATDRQYEAVETILNERPGVPVIMFSHAPPIGCGLRTVPNVHVRATNAYLSQNHKPIRWLNLAQRYPEIVMWYSAHYHLGHSHHDSLTYRHGTWFFTTGVHGSATRDGDRQSRVIDLEEDRVFVRTLCHERRAIDDRYEWSHQGALRTLIGTSAVTEIGNQSEQKKQVTGGPVCVERSPVVGAPPINRGLEVLPGGNLLLATTDGNAWEIQMKLKSVIGTLYLSDDNPLSGICVSDDSVWMSNGHRLLYVNANDVWRFIRGRKSGPRHRPFLFDEEITSIAQCADGGVFVACGRRIWSIDSHQIRQFLTPPPGVSGYNGASKRLGDSEITWKEKPVFEMSVPISRMIWESRPGPHGILWIIDETKTLWQLDLTTQKLKRHAEGVLAWDVYEGDCVGIIASDETKRIDSRYNTLTLMRIGANDTSSSNFPHSGPNTWPQLTQVVSLSNGKAVINLNGAMFYDDGQANELILLQSEGRVNGISRALNGEDFFAGMTFADDERHMEIQRWTVKS